MARILIGEFTTNRDPSYIPAFEKADRLTQLLQAQGITAKTGYDGGEPDWDGQIFPEGRRVFVEVDDADFERANALVKAAG
jgi:hypothetical protein